MIPSRLEPLLDTGAAPRELALRFAASGKVLYLVGGSVRDALLGRTATGTDLDFATDARPDETRTIVSDWAHDLYLAGQTFGTIGAIKDGHVYEITTFRSEVYREDSRKPVVTFSDHIDTDLSRRDFTVNAMAIRLPASGEAPEMIDPHGGLSDLAAAVLRCPLDPHVSFGDDPLRMVRLFRFVSQLGFVPDDAALAAVREMAARLGVVSAERIRAELDKLMTGEFVGPALWGLLDSGLAAEFLPELPALAVEQDPVHRHKDVLAHTVAVVEKVAAVEEAGPDLTLRLAALFHDVGKPATRRFEDGGVTFHHHEVVGARMTKERMAALRYSNQMVDDVSRLVFLHMRPHTYKMGWTDSAVRRYVRDAGPLLDKLNALVRCDVTTRNVKRARAIERRITELEERIVELRQQEELDALRPPIDGNAVMAHLGLPPGPLVGEAVRLLTEHRIEHGPFTDQEALALLDAWWAERGATS